MRAEVKDFVSLPIWNKLMVVAGVRLKMVVEGEQGGISDVVNWKGGGGFKFYILAASLIKRDKYGNEIINSEYKAIMLAAAMAKQEGFRYSPDENNYWKQGFSTEKDFIYTTTQFVTVEMLDRLAEELKPHKSAANALWPKTTIATAAVQNLLGGDFLMQMSRTPEIVADAAYHILSRPSTECTGNFFIDEDVLKQEGINDLEKYAVNPQQKLMTDLFLE